MSSPDRRPFYWHKPHKPGKAGNLNTVSSTVPTGASTAASMGIGSDMPIYPELIDRIWIDEVPFPKSPHGNTESTYRFEIRLYKPIPQEPPTEEDLRAMLNYEAFFLKGFRSLNMSEEKINHFKSPDVHAQNGIRRGLGLPDATDEKVQAYRKKMIEQSLLNLPKNR